MRKSILNDLLTGRIVMTDDSGHKFEVSASPIVIGGVRSAVVDYYRVRYHVTDVCIDTSELPDEFGGRQVYFCHEVTGENIGVMDLYLTRRGDIITA